MRILTAIATILALTTGAEAGSSLFKTAIVGLAPTPFCSSKSVLINYQLNRLNNPVKAAALRAKCGTLPAGEKVSLIYSFGDEVAGAYVVQVRTTGDSEPQIGYALTSGFSIAQARQQ